MSETERFIIFAFTYFSSRLVPIFTNQDVENIISMLFDIDLSLIKNALLKSYAKKRSE